MHLLYGKQLYLQLHSYLVSKHIAYYIRDKRHDVRDRLRSASTQRRNLITYVNKLIFLSKIAFTDDYYIQLVMVSKYDCI